MNTKPMRQIILCTLFALTCLLLPAQEENQEWAEISPFKLWSKACSIYEQGEELSINGQHKEALAKFLEAKSMLEAVTKRKDGKISKRIVQSRINLCLRRIESLNLKIKQMAKEPKRPAYQTKEPQIMSNGGKADAVTKDEVAQLRDELAQCKKQLYTSFSEVESAKRDARKYAKAFEQVQGLLKENKDLKEKNALVKVANEKLKKQLEAKATQPGSSDSKLIEERTKFDALQKQFVKLTETAKELRLKSQESLAKKTEAEYKLKLANDANTKLKSDNKTLNMRLNDQAKVENDQGQTVKKLEDNLAESQADVARLTDDYKKLQKDVETLRGEAAVDAATKQIHLENQVLQKKLQDSLDQQQKLTKSSETATTQAAELKQKVAEQAKTLAAVAKKQQDSDKAAKELTKKFSDLQIVADEEKRRANTLAASNTQLKHELEQFAGKIKKQAKAVKDIEFLAEENLKLKKDVKALKQQLADASKAPIQPKEDNTELKKAMEQLQKQLTDSVKGAATLQQQLNATQAELKKAKTQLAAKSKEAVEVEQLNALKKDLTAAQNDLAKSQQQVKELTEKANASAAPLQAAEKANADLQRKLKKSQADLNNLKQQTESAKGDLDKSTKRLGAQAETIKKLQADKAEADQKLTELDQKLQAAQEAAKQPKVDPKVAEDLKKATGKLEKLQASVTAAEANKAMIEKQNTELNQQLAESQVTMQKLQTASTADKKELKQLQKLVTKLNDKVNDATQREQTLEALKTAAAKMQETNANLNKKLETAEADLKELKANQVSKEDLDKATAAAKQLTKERDMLKSKLEESLDGKDDLSRVRKRVVALELDKLDLGKQLKTAEQENQKALADQKAKHDLVVQDLTKQKADLTEQLAGLTKSAQELEQLKRRFVDLKTEHLTFKKQTTEEQTKTDKKLAELASLRKQVKAGKGNAAKLKKANQELTELKKTQSNLEEKLKEQTATGKTVTDLKEKLAQVEKRNDKLETMTGNSKASAEEIAKLKKQLSKLEDEKQALETQIKDLKQVDGRNSEELAEIKKKLMAETTTVNAELLKRKDQAISALVKETEDYKQQVQALTQDRDLLFQRLKRLAEEIKRQRATIQKLQANQ